MIRSTVFMCRKRQSWNALLDVDQLLAHLVRIPPALGIRRRSCLNTGTSSGLRTYGCVTVALERTRAARAVRGARDGAGTRRRATARAAARRARRTPPRRGGTRRPCAAFLLPSRNSIARYCADWNPDDVPSAGRKPSYSDGVSVSSTAHCSKSCFWISLTRARILKHGSSAIGAHVRDRRRELVDHQLHPQLGRPGAG